MKSFRSSSIWVTFGLSVLFASSAAGQGVGFRSAQYITGTAPEAIVVGDFNGDGKLDLAIANVRDNTVSILLGNGDGTFGVKTDFATGTEPRGIVADDFNGDGKLDLAVANATDSTISILLGNGDGTFAAKTDIPTGTNPVGITSGDFNGDGKVDLITANSGSNDISIVLGHGDGTFATKVNFPTGTHPIRVVAGDFNGDTKLDVAAVSDQGNVVSMLLGNGDGTFQAKKDAATGSSPWSLAKSDFDGDAKLDLVVANLNSWTASILHGKGDGTFDPKTDLGTDTQPIAVTAADFNADGKSDFLTANAGYYYLYYGYQYGQRPKAALRLGNGDGTFSNNIFSFGLALDPSGMAIGDFNGDGRIDLAITNSADNAVSILLQSAAAQFSPGGLDFGSVASASTSPNLDEQLDNTGSFPMTVSNVGISGTDASQFSVTADTCTGVAINSLSHCTVSVVFSPTSVGPKAAQLTFTHDAPGSPSTIGLSGNGLAPLVPFPIFAPSSFDFGGITVGHTNSTTVALTNNGTATLNITSVTLTGPNATEFALTNHCGATLASAANCTIDVAFKPTSGGTKSASVSIVTNAASSPDTVPLTGMALTPAVSLSPGSLTFNGQVVNTTSTAQSVTLDNTGAGYLDISSLTLTGANAGDFTRSDNCGTGFNGGASCLITITFKPTAAGNRTATITISSNASGSPHTVALTGTGTDFSIAPASGSSTNMTVNRGGSGSFTLSFSPMSGYTGSVMLGCTSSSAEVACSVPASVNINGTSAANVTVNVITTSRAALPPLLRVRPPNIGDANRARNVIAWLCVFALLAGMLRGKRSRGGTLRRGLRGAVAAIVILLSAQVWTGCGGGVSAPPPPRTYSITVNANAAGVSHSITLNVTVTS